MPFLFGIMRFRGAAVMRRHRRAASQETPIDDLPETSDALAAKSDQHRGLEAEELRNAIARLPEGEMNTENLIERLASQLMPVRRIARPGTRLARWLLISVPAAALVAWSFGLRPDLAGRLGDPVFLVEEGAAVLTALVGAYAALCAGLPDQPGWKAWLPATPMALWLGVLGQQCLDVVLRLGPGGLQITADPTCLPAIAMGGLVPAIAIVAMLRRGGKFRTTHACLCGASGAAALGAASLRLYHTQDASITVLVWQFGSVALFSLVAGAVGRVLVDSRPEGTLIS